MPFSKGHRKTGGKRKGTKNQKTLLLDSFAQSVVDGGMEKFQSELRKLSGKDYVYAYLTLFEYVKPKLSRVDNQVSGGMNLTWNEVKKYGADPSTNPGT